MSNQNQFYQNNPNKHQINRIVKFMVENPSFAMDETVLDFENQVKYHDAWRKLSGQLNMRGSPVKTTESWKQVWNSYKYNIMKKCEIANSYDASGNYKTVYFDDNETVIKKLLFDDPVKQSKLLETSVICEIDLTTSNANCEEELSAKTESPTMFNNVTDATNELQLVDPVSISSSVDSEEEHLSTLKTESPIMFNNATDATNELQLVDTVDPLPSISVNIETTYIQQTDNQLNFHDEYAKIKEQLRKLKTEKTKILKQTSEVKHNYLVLKEKLQELSKEKFEIKRQQLKYKALKLDLKKKELQMKEGAKLRNSINSKFKKIF